MLKNDLKVQILGTLSRSFIILVDLTMKWFSEKMLIFNVCRHGLIPNFIKKYWTVSTFHTSQCLLYSYTHFFKQDEIYESQYAFINPLESGHIEFLESIFITILILRKSSLKLKHLPWKILHFDEKSAKIQPYLDLA